MKRNKKIKVTDKNKRYIRFCPKCSSINVQQDKSTMQSLGYLPTKYICCNCGFSSFTMPDIDVNKTNKLKIKNKKSVNLSKIESEKIDTSYGKFITMIFWKISGPLSLIIGFVLLFAVYVSESINYFNLVYSLFLIMFGGFACYISYLKQTS
ncbi:hypothetical protein HYV80_00085 [Candidatus Woesearchaeota archaeon]|nr:hypothetical protein [Candidatus Woesearchaeota archaeon]